MQSNKGMKWVLLALLVGLMSATAVTGTAEEPQAQPSSITCGDSADCQLPGPALEVVNRGAGAAIRGRSRSARIGVLGIGQPGVRGTSTNGAGVEANSTYSFGLKATSTHTAAVYARSTAGSGVWGESQYAYGVVGKVVASSGTTYGVYGEVESPDGAGGYFHNTQGGNAVYLDGDAAQTLETTGLVKAAVAGWCVLAPHWNCGIYRSFNNVAGTIAVIPGAGPGEFTVDLGFDASERFWAPTLNRPAGYSLVCDLGGTNTQLDCDVEGSTNFAFMVLVY